MIIYIYIHNYVSESEPVPNTEQQIIILVLSILIPMLLFAIVSPLLYWCYRRRKSGYFNEVWKAYVQIS